MSLTPTGETTSTTEAPAVRRARHRYEFAGAILLGFIGVVTLIQCQHAVAQQGWAALMNEPFKGRHSHGLRVPWWWMAAYAVFWLSLSLLLLLSALRSLNRSGDAKRG